MVSLALLLGSLESNLYPRSEHSLSYHHPAQLLLLSSRTYVQASSRCHIDFPLTEAEESLLSYCHASLVATTNAGSSLLVSFADPRRIVQEVVYAACSGTVSVTGAVAFLSHDKVQAVSIHTHDVFMCLCRCRHVNAWSDSWPPL